MEIKEEAYTPISVIITAHDNARELENNLPSFLAQDYPSEFQVVVVAEKGDHDTEAVLEKYSGNEHLYYTLIPNSSRYMSRKKLQITLGVKAAKYEWVLLTEITCVPSSNQWLKKMAGNCSDNTNLVMGYVALDEETPASRRFEHIYHATPLFHRASKKTAWRTNCQNLMFRKSEFIQQDGFRGNLHLLRGEYDFIVNKYAKRHHTAVELSSEARLIEKCPTNKEWQDRHLYAIATRQALKRSFFPKCWYRLRLFLFPIIALLFGGLLVHSYLMENPIIMGIAGAGIILSYIINVFILRHRIRRYDQRLHCILMPLYELGILWKNFFNLIKYKRAKKIDFTSHRL